MTGVLLKRKIRIGLLCLCTVLNFYLLSYGASPQQPAEQPSATGNKESATSPLSPSIKTPTVKSTVQNEKKKAPREGVKVAHPGPPPAHIREGTGLTIPLKHRSKNPIDLSTGKELTP